MSHMLRSLKYFKIHEFLPRHIGTTIKEQKAMLSKLDCHSLDELIGLAIPKNIISKSPLNARPTSENIALEELLSSMNKNLIFKSYIGMGYHNTFTPNVIKRNLLENPAWYTQYTPYQAEISQGRLESLLNFQTLICELTGLGVSNASLLDEPTAAAEAMQMMYNITGKSTLIVDGHVHPHTVEMLVSRAGPLNIKLVISYDMGADIEKCNDFMGILLQYPNTLGIINDYTNVIEKCHSNKGLCAMGSDLLSLMKLKSPKHFNADIAFGNAQRFGVPLGYGGPHAAYFATDKKYIRKMPGRIVGVSKDVDDNIAYRLTLQTREQHIKRERATSNICTAQALLANISAMYAVYHGKEGLLDLATKLHINTVRLHAALSTKYKMVPGQFFDTLSLYCDTETILKRSEKFCMNFRVTDGICTIALDETVTAADLNDICKIFDVPLGPEATNSRLEMLRTDSFLEQPVFQYKSETEMLRYMYKLQKKDLSLADAMIPLGSCTMKLNATSEMIPLSNPKINNIHPFAPLDQAKGYTELINNVRNQLIEITGMDDCSIEPNSGAQGEYAGLKVIRDYFKTRDGKRSVALIPTSAHGTNPASAIMSGFKVVSVNCLPNGYLDVDDLKSKIKKYNTDIGVLMITYPSTFGVFDDNITTIVDLIHEIGAQIYLDGANLNAQVGLCKPGEYGADVCHLNLHKTFCIPHGGGGPGVGPICVKKHLAPYLPSHAITTNKNTMAENSTTKSTSVVSGAPYGSASILTITWMYIKMMGGEGLKKASQVAVLNANYMAEMLKHDYKVLFTNKNNKCAHEFIIDADEFEPAGITATDIAKRLLDYGFHAPTMSWPVANTLMIEPTESEPLEEIERFIKALKMIREEIREVSVSGEKDNVLKNAPHTIEMVAKEWKKPYDRIKAVYPDGNVTKFWPTTRRVNDGFGDKQLVCTCPPMDYYSK